LGADGQVDGRDIQGRDADRLGLDAAGQLRQQALDAAGQAGRYRDDRLHGGAGAAQVVVVIAVDQRLVVHHRMQRGEQHLFDADFAVEQIEHRDDGVGRAGGGGNQFFGAGQAVLVDAGDDGRVDIAAAVAGVRQQQARAAGIDKTGQFCPLTVAAGGFDHQIDPEAAPIDVFRRRAWLMAIG
jgi:hypothetical protein